jgi:hypothetical protein
VRRTSIRHHIVRLRAFPNSKSKEKERTTDFTDDTDKNLRIRAIRNTNRLFLCGPRRIFQRRSATPLRVGERVLIHLGMNTQVSAFDSFEIDTQKLLGPKKIRKRGDHERRERHEIKTRNETQGLVNQSQGSGPAMQSDQGYFPFDFLFFRVCRFRVFRVFRGSSPFHIARGAYENEKDAKGC